MVEEEAEDAQSETWRVGRHQPRNIYHGDKFIAVAVGSDWEAEAYAQTIVRVVNEAQMKTRQQ